MLLLHSASALINWDRQMKFQCIVNPLSAKPLFKISIRLRSGQATCNIQCTHSQMEKQQWDEDRDFRWQFASPNSVISNLFFNKWQWTITFCIGEDIIENFPEPFTAIPIILAETGGPFHWQIGEPFHLALILSSRSRCGTRCCRSAACSTGPRRRWWLGWRLWCACSHQGKVLHHPRPRPAASLVVCRLFRTALRSPRGCPRRPGEDWLAFGSCSSAAGELKDAAGSVSKACSIYAREPIFTLGTSEVV